MLHWFAKRLNEAKKEEAGFTLVELLIVCVIIGVLAAIAIPAFLEQRQAAWVATCRSDARNGAAAATAWAADHNGGYTGGMTAALLGSDYGWKTSANTTHNVVSADAGGFVLEATQTDLTSAGAPDTCTFDSDVGRVTGPA